jgi:hypothetical protein
MHAHSQKYAHRDRFITSYVFSIAPTYIFFCRIDDTPDFQASIFRRDFRSEEGGEDVFETPEIRFCASATRCSILRRKSDTTCL